MNIKKVKEKFLKEYKDAFAMVGNNLAVGIGLDTKTGEDTIEVRLTNNKLKSTLPTTYEGAKVNVQVIGVIKAL